MLSRGSEDPPLSRMLLKLVNPIGGFDFAIFVDHSLELIALLTDILDDRALLGPKMRRPRSPDQRGLRLGGWRGILRRSFMPAQKPRPEGIETFDIEVFGAGRILPAQKPRPEGIETQGSPSISTVRTSPAQKPRPEGIETVLAICSASC